MGRSVDDDCLSIADARTYASAGVVRIPGKARCVIGTKPLHRATAR